jgi:hypothetical protein
MYNESESSSLSFDGVSAAPSVSVKIQKVGNGYTLQLTTNPPRPPVAYGAEPSPFDGMGQDEIIDKLVDGAGALLGRLHDAGAGESWRDDEDRQQVREAFKLMFPGVARQFAHPPGPPPVESRHESLVFETKAKLMEFMEKEL